MKKQILTAVLMLNIIIIGANAVNANEVKQAQKHPQGIQKTKLSNEEMKEHMKKRADEFNKALGLTPEQIAKAKEVRAQGHTKMKPLIEKKKAKIEELDKITKNDSMSVKKQDKKIESLRNDIKKINQDILQIRRDNEKQFQSILTEEQKVKYAQIKEEGKKHYREHKKPQGPENFKHRPAMYNK